MFKSFSMDLAGRKLTVEIGRVAAQANGAAFMHYGDTVVLSTATASSKPREGIDFFPLSVEYEEKLYAVGKIPGGFNKREGKASENAILTSRVIDRPMRPLFPKDYRNDVTLDNVVMSVDPECSPELTAMLKLLNMVCLLFFFNANARSYHRCRKTPKLLIWAKESFGTHQQSRSEPSASNPVFWCKTGWNLRSTLMFHELLSDAQLLDQCTIAFQICLL